jgi:alpha-glucosidase (family GH31 glycosyl hydrolase)
MYIVGIVSKPAPFMMDASVKQVWPGPVFFPDYTNPATEQWWGDESVLFKEQLDYAGLWIVRDTRLCNP